MEKSKKRTILTIVTMTILSIIVVWFYFYWSNRTVSTNDASDVELTEVDKFLNKDLELYYPETPREVVKLYSGMMKLLYTDIDDEQVKSLALKIRELYDVELIEINPKEQYLNNLYTEIASWKEKGRKITNYLLYDEEAEAVSTIDGMDYATVYISYTVQENGKVTERWRFLLRKNELGRWKLLGWEYVPEENV